MKITAIREETVSLAAGLRNAGIAYDAMTASAVVVDTDGGLRGLGFDSVGRYGHGALLRERFVPRLLDAAPGDLLDGDGLVDPAAAWRIMMANEKPGGHGERAGAVGVLDMALWDLRARQRGEPAWRTIAGYFGHAGAPDVSVYGTGGHYGADAADTGPLRASLAEARGCGFRTFKIKIGGAPLATDLARIEAALAIAGPGALALDTNGVWEPATATDWLAALADYDLAWIEEPVSPLDYVGLADLAGRFPVAIGTGENLFSFDDARNLQRHGGLRPDRDLLQFDISLSYGLPEFVRMVDCFTAKGWSPRRFAPHAGHVLALHTVAALGLGMAEVALDAALPIGGLPGGVQVEDGRVTLPDVPGFGIETMPALHACFAGLLD
ncbi:MAG: mandelate racemase [Rhodospirillaceae bacterium]|nr:mandelate racemase [Rhodospirillaceae bacterium]